MKRAILVSCVIFFIVASQVMGDGEWLPDNAEIVPQNPISGDIVAITLSGTWPDSCVPNSSDVSVARDGEIHFNVFSDLSDICTQEVTPWELTESVGPLPPGTYRVYVSLDGGPRTLMTEFNVIANPAVGTHTYVFWPRYCSVVQTGGIAGIKETYGIEGRLELTVDFDAGTASFDMIDANLVGSSEYLDVNAVDLGALFDMTELVGTVVSGTEIDFDTPNPVPGGKVVHLDVNICGIYTPMVEICLSGGFCESVQDGFCFEMNALLNENKHFYVDANATGANNGSSWENAFTDLQDALDDVDYGCEVWVAKGTYKPTSQTGGDEQSATFRITEGVMMYGGFNGTETTRSERNWIKNETILSGDIDNDGLHDADNVWHVVYATYSWIGPTAGIDGFTVTGGYADGQHPENNGGGIYIHGGGENHPSPTIANCKIIDNYADISGAGMFIEHGGPNVVNCSFIGNSSGNGGGIACWSGNLTLTNSMFSGNSAISDGGAIACADSNMIVTNCTFAQNTAGFMGGGIFSGIGSWVRVYNSILWDNTADFGNHWYNFGGSIVAHYSCVQGNWNDGNQTCTNDDPLFVDANGTDGIAGTEDDNLRLSADSPCIDVGDNSVVTVSTDLDDNLRIININGTVDMGAYEFYPDFVYVDDDAIGDPRPGDPNVSDPCENGTEVNPFDSIQEAIDMAGGGVTIIIADGVYTGKGNKNIDFKGKAITVIGENGAENTIIDCENDGRGFYFHRNEGPNSRLQEVTIRNGGSSCAGILCEGSSPTIVSCILTNNSGGADGGIFCDNGSNPVISDCSFIGNSGLFSSGVRCDDNSSPTITNCTFTACSGATVLFFEHGSNSSATVNNCLFWDNNVNVVITAETSCDGVTIGNCIINDNNSRAINCSGSPVITNCTIINNTDIGQKGAIQCESGGNPAISNCIFRSNTPEEIYIDGSGAPVITYSNVQGGWEGKGNIDVDPLFVDPCDGDYHLKSEGWRW